jgi:hypothetical protein
MSQVTKLLFIIKITYMVIIKKENSENRETYEKKKKINNEIYSIFKKLHFTPS